MTAICGKKENMKNLKTEFPFGNLENLEFETSFRSPQGIFVALGEILRDATASKLRPRTSESQRVFDSEPLLTIVSDSSKGCYIFSPYDGQSFCVPQGAYRTSMVIDILEQLKNLSTTPTDLNSAFSVRVID